MAERALLKIVTEKFVKPSSPTPPSSKYYKLSCFDAHFVDHLTVASFFYPKESYHGVKSCMELLETSLSKTLEYYYPFAGRLADDKISIDCNDAGVHLWEVQIQASISEILDRLADNNVRNMVFPREMYNFNSTSSRIMVQLNHFTCGGICVGICMSHELGDGQSLSSFMNDWAAIARASHDIPPLQLPSPIFPGVSIFPPLDHSPFRRTGNITSMTQTRRFVFSALSISKLKNMVATDSEIENPTKVEVVTALIFKSAVSASRRVSNSFKPSSLCHAINFRPLTRPPFSDNYMGNFSTLFSITTTEEREMRLSRLVTQIRKCKVEVQDAFRSTRLEENNLLQQVSRCSEEVGKKLWNKNFELYIFSSCCKFPFYNIDFGWGKPGLAFMGGLTENIILLMGTPSGDGIEAFVTLKQDQMSIFRQDEELLAFATLNPSICVPN